MSKIVAIYSSEADLTSTMDDLYAQHVNDDDVTLVQGTGDIAKGSENVAPVGAGATNKASSVTPNPATGAIAVGTLSDMTLDSEQRAFYEQQLEGGASLLFIDMEDNEASRDAIKSTLHGASRVDEIS